MEEELSDIVRRIEDDEIAENGAKIIDEYVANYRSRPNSESEAVANDNGMSIALDLGPGITPEDIRNPVQATHSEEMLNHIFGVHGKEDDPPALSDLSNLDPKFIVAYNRACAEGSQAVFKARLMIVGHYGAGKTSLKRRILNKPFLAEYNVTNGIDVDPAACKVDIDNTSNWTQVQDAADGGYAQQVANETLRFVKENPAASDARSQGANAVTDDPSTTPDRGTSGVQNDVTDLPEEVKKHLRLKGTKSGGDEDNPETVLIWDFAGQEIFYTTHQVFLTHRAIYLVVVNLMEAFGLVNEDQQDTDFEASCQTIANLLDYWLNCIYTHTTLRRPKGKSPESIMIVLTHKDKVEKRFPDVASQMIRDYQRSIIQHIIHKVYFNHVLLEFFTVANNSEDEQEVIQLRKTILNLTKAQPYWGEQIPLKWIAVRDKLRGENKNQQVITLREVRKICEDAGISDDTEMFNVLRFYNELGEIVYFNDCNLRNLIILDPQWLIDSFSQIITIPRFHLPGRDEQWDILGGHGMVTEALLEHIWEPTVKGHLTSLMYKFKLMLPMRFCQMTYVYKELTHLDIKEDLAYLIPCLLPLKETHQRGQVGFDSIPDILVAFVDGFIPVGVMSHLISALVMNEAWTLSGKVYKNHAVFLPEGQDSNLSLSIQQGSGHLRLTGSITGGQPLPQMLRLHLLVLLEQLWFVVRGSCPNARFELAVECGCQSAEPQVVRIGPTAEWMEGNVTVYCNQHNKKFSTARFSPWFNVGYEQKPRSVEVNGQEYLSDRTLKKVADKLGADWRRLGYLLVKSEIVEDLCTPLQGGPGLYGLRMLIKWHQSLACPNISSVKQQLIKVLTDEGRQDLVNIINSCSETEANEQQLFHRISRGLTRTWRAVGERLGVGRDVMDEIETPQMPYYQPGLHLLVKWRNLGGGRMELVEGLKELYLNTIAQTLEIG